MEDNVTQLEPARLQGLFKKLKVEKQNGVFATASLIHNTARRRASDGSVKNKDDVANIIKEVYLLRYAGFIEFDIVVKDIIPLLLISLGLPQDNKAKAAMKKEIDDREPQMFRELSPILELEDQHLVAEKIEAYQERYYFRATSKGIYIHDVDRVDKPVNPQSFAKQHISPMMPGDHRKLVSFGQFLVDNNRLREFEDVICDSRKPTLIVKFDHKLKRAVHDINTWKGWTYADKPALENPEQHVKCTLKHMKEILANNDDKQYHYLMNYLATWVQTPWIIPGVALFFYGRQGCGKDIIVSLLQKIIHASHFTSINDKVFKDKDNSWAMARKFVHVREFTKVSDPRIMAHLNDVLESAMIRYRILWTDGISVENPGFYWVSSNNEDAIPATVDTRRWKVFHCNEKYASQYNATPEFLDERVNYFRNINAEIEGLGPQALYQILNSYSLQDIKELSINSVGFEEMMEETQSALDIFINDLVLQGRIPNYNDMLVPGMEIAYPQFSMTEDTRVESQLIRQSYTVLWNRYGKQGPGPHSKSFSKSLLLGLGLPWEEGDKYKNNRRHLKSINSSLYYIFPPIPELKQKYGKRRPTT